LSLNKHHVFVVGLLLLIASCVTEQFPQVSERQVQVAPNVFLAGLILDAKLDLLEAQDIVVIDLRTADEGIDTEKQAMEKRGITYANIPIAEHVSRSQVEQLQVLMHQYAGSRVLLHCVSGNRAGMLWGAHLVEQGASAEEAIEAVSTIVTKVPVNVAIENYGRGAETP